MIFEDSGQSNCKTFNIDRTVTGILALNDNMLMVSSAWPSQNPSVMFMVMKVNSFWWMLPYAQDARSFSSAPSCSRRNQAGRRFILDLLGCSNIPRDLVLFAVAIMLSEE